MSLSIKGTDLSDINESIDLTAQTKEAIKNHLDQVDALLTQENLHPVILADGESLKPAVDPKDPGDEGQQDEKDDHGEKDDEEHENENEND
jgi:hypothetical protein